MVGGWPTRGPGQRVPVAMMGSLGSIGSVGLLGNPLGAAPTAT
ncbi:hypothetical protein I551_5733 [Mycobacterium ulcerans str. Harvey]|uniref:Uncharacterized protein n=1 Tax=Mycobacterium ulcerans str. Harvey TaxID=1299332 RepID=A0ABP3AAZ8_MYCUL|nr:hypothetical protein I551_5733 [Mycobacterium ulcerans str. Harvey]